MRRYIYVFAILCLWASSAHADDRNTAHAPRIHARPTYMGLRVVRNTPELTREDARSGVVGFTVVRARRNAVTPATLKPVPINTITAAAMKRRVSDTWSNGANRDAPHIATAMTAATTGGGPAGLRPAAAVVPAAGRQPQQQKPAIRGMAGWVGLRGTP